MTAKNPPIPTAATAATAASVNSIATESTETHIATSGDILNLNDNLDIELDLEQFEHEVAELAPEPSSPEKVEDDTDEEDEQYDDAQQEDTDMSELDEEEEQKELNDQIASLRRKLNQKIK